MVEDTKPPEAEKKDGSTDPAIAGNTPAAKPENVGEKKVRSAIALARSYIANGMKSQAREILEDAIAKYPTVPETAKAKRMLEGLK
jgi:hypothetical protein